MNKSATDEDGDTPLTTASIFGQVDVVRALLEAGADMNMSSTGGYGGTPLTEASFWGYVEVVRALLEAGADMNKRNSDGKSPLYLALKKETWHEEQHRQGRAQVAALLREAGAQELQPHELESL